MTREQGQKYCRGLRTFRHKMRVFVAALWDLKHETLAKEADSMAKELGDLADALGTEYADPQEETASNGTHHD